MATVNGDNYAKALDPTPSSNQLDPAAWGSKVRCQFDVYEAAAAADGTLIRIAKVPKGARLLDVIVAFDDLGTGAYLAVQTEDGSAEEIHANIDVSSAAGQAQGVKVDFFGYQFTADTVIVLEVETAAITGTIHTAVLYTYQ
jgi:hypothetical protein